MGIVELNDRWSSTPQGKQQIEQSAANALATSRVESNLAAGIDGSGPCIVQGFSLDTRGSPQRSFRYNGQQKHCK